MSLIDQKIVECQSVITDCRRILDVEGINDRPKREARKRLHTFIDVMGTLKELEIDFKKLKANA